MAPRHASNSSRRKRKFTSPLFDPLASQSKVIQLRKAFFAIGAESAMRYGVSFDRLLQHLWQARHYHRPVCLRAIAHLDDLIQATACAARSPLAWADLIEVGEPALVQVCQRRLDDASAVVFVRRMLSELKTNCDRRPQRGLLTLQAYIGVQPLRNWLAERAATRLGQMAVRAVQDRRPFGMRPASRGKRNAIDRTVRHGSPALRFPVMAEVAAGPAAAGEINHRLRIREQEA